MNADTSEGRALLCQCLTGVSMADGDLDSREIATQISITEQITGIAPSADEIVAATIEMGEWEDFIEALAKIKPQLSPEFCTQILKACILIGRADDSMQDAEGDRIRQIAEVLGFSPEVLERELSIIR